jgi:eukaryotic-like serine/threonine-protein kinase
VTQTKRPLARDNDAEGGRDEWGFRKGDPLVPGRVTVLLLGGGERYETYLAWDERLLALVVVKIVRPHLVTSNRALNGLAAEAALLERLRHPVIVRSFNAVLDGHRPHLVLEHLDGPRLSTLVRRYGPLEPEQLLPLGLQLCSAIHYLAEEGIVHLDVKPSNIIMGAPARLIDLSIARSVHELRDTRRRIGTDAYMSPEQCDPEARGAITGAADVWGVGATLYYAICGHPPFAFAATGPRYPQLTDAAQPLPNSVAPELAELIDSCLRPNGSERPAPAEVAARLEPLVDELPRRALMSRLRVRPQRRR